MNRENVIEYIKRGLSPVSKKKKYFSSAVALLFPCLVALAAGDMVEEIRPISAATIAVSFISAIVLFFLSRRKSTVKNRLIMSSAIKTVFVIITSLLMSIYYYDLCGFDSFFFLILLFSILIPLLPLMWYSARIKKEQPIYSKKNKTRNIYYWGAISGTLGYSFAKYFLAPNLANEQIGALLIVCLAVIICSFNTSNALSLQRLYYLCKLEKAGLVCEKDFEFCE